MKCIIILTASTGAGHNQAAANLKRAFETHGIYVHIVDMFKSTSKGMNALISDGYKVLATKLPKAYGIFYKSSNHKTFNKVVFRNVFLATELRLKWIINEFKPDMIISTHPFGAPIVGKLKDKGKIDLPFVQIVTDFKAHYAYIQDSVDAYVVASKFTANSLVERGIASEKIHIYGIPTREEFMRKRPRQFSADQPFRLLIMGGSMGLQSIKQAVDSLLTVDKKLQLIVVCGKNAALTEQLTNQHQSAITTGKLAVHGFVNNIDELMDQSDLIISKPGGLTTTEAIHKSIPMIIPFAIPGQEEENTSFLVENEMAIEVQDIDKLHHHIESLIDDIAQYEKMVKNMLNLSKTYSVDAIIEMCIAMIKR